MILPSDVYFLEIHVTVQWRQGSSNDPGICTRTTDTEDDHLVRNTAVLTLMLRRAGVFTALITHL